MISSICKKYGIENYTINPDGTIDVNGNVDLSMKKLTKLPLKFNKVSGFFDCSSSQLITLEGCPKEVGGSFYCEYNKLTTLEGCPKEIGGCFNCINNQLTLLDGGPKEVGGNFYCDKCINNIESFITESFDGTAEIDYNRYRKVNDRDKIINNILLYK